MHLPQIDLTRPSPNRVEQILRAIQEYGAFYVKTEFTEEDCRQLFLSSTNLFSIPAQVKQEYQVKPGGFTRGFLRLGGESGSDLYELKEGFSYGYELKAEPKNKLQGQNVWPKDTKESTVKTLQKFFTFCSTLSLQLTGLLSQAFTGDERWLEHCADGDTISLMRLFHYFSSDGKDSIGSSPHTDWGFLTIIKAQECQPSLQIATRVGDHTEWHDVPATPLNQSEPWAWFLVNGGDFLSMISNGQSVSPLHRVISTQSERTSFVYFAYPAYPSRVPSFYSKDLSLFQDQKSHVVGNRTIESTQDCFGDFIYKKWEQVSRY
jgi:isopenicillin N synthase-like dioxygenase